MHQYRFRVADVTGSGSNSTDQVYAKGFRAFCDSALAFRSYRIADLSDQKRQDKVALLLSPADYPDDVRSRIRAVIEDAGRSIVDIPWLHSISRALLEAMGEADWVIVDLGDDAASAGIVCFLHGVFVPAIRLEKLDPARSSRSLKKALFGAHEVGFPKDVVQWSDPEALEAALRVRVATILLEPRLIDTYDAPKSYFESAALRKDVIFVSYASSDAAIAEEIIAALKRTFRTVFDYKDGNSIVPGKPWVAEISESLSRATVAVALLSEAYLASGNCMHEANQNVALRDNSKLQFLPVRLHDGNLDIPEQLKHLQHARLLAMESPAEVVLRVKRLLADTANVG